jgi:hypothetical protein
MDREEEPKNGIVVSLYRRNNNRDAMMEDAVGSAVGSDKSKQVESAVAIMDKESEGIKRKALETAHKEIVVDEIAQDAEKGGNAENNNTAVEVIPVNDDESNEGETKNTSAKSTPKLMNDDDSDRSSGGGTDEKPKARKNGKPVENVNATRTATRRSESRKRTFEPFIGMRFEKKFTVGIGEDTREEVYIGSIVSGPESVENKYTGEEDLEWHVRYEDGDEEDMSLDEFLACRIIDGTSKASDKSVEANNSPAARRSDQSRKRTIDNELFEPFIGMRFQKRFDDGEYYIGTIVSGPESVQNKYTGEEDLEWHARYEDGDEEDMSLDEFLMCRIIDTKRPLKKAAPNKVSKYEQAKQALCALPTMTEDEVVAALNKVGPPYGMQAVTDSVHKARDANDYAQPSSGLFSPEIGLRIRKMFGGRNWYGTVTRDAEMVEEPSEVEGEPPRAMMMWQVTYDNDNDVDDMTWQELFQHRADRPIRSAPCRGRVLQSLELFSGEYCGLTWYIYQSTSCPCCQLTTCLFSITRKRGRNYHPGVCGQKVGSLFD